MAYGKEILKKRMEYYYCIILNMLDEDINLQDYPNFDNIKDFLRNITQDDLILLKNYVGEIKSPWQSGNSTNPEEEAKKNNFLVILIDDIITEINDIKRVIGIYNILCTLSSDKFINFLDTVNNVNDLLLLDHYLKAHKLDKNIEKQDSFYNIIDEYVRKRVGKEFLSAE